MTTEFAPQLKLLCHPEQVRAFLGQEDDAPPVNVEISPTNDCNAKCDWCFYVASDYKQKHSKEEIDIDILESCLWQMSAMGVRSVSWTGGGDPSVYSHIDDAILEAHRLGLQQGMFTNAYRAIEYPEMLDWIRVTVTEKFVITKHVADYARATKTGVNFNLCRANEVHLPRMVKESRDAGAHYFQVRPALADRHDLQEEVDKPEWLMEFDSPDFRIVLTDYKWDDYLKPHGYPVCHGHRFVPFLWFNGDLSVCAYHFGKEPYILGNVNEAGFNKVWYGERRAKMLAQGIPVIPECQHCCKLHEINKPLAMLRGGVEDKEFP